MRRWLIGLVAATAVAAPARTEEKPADVVKKAVAAHGGVETLKKYPAGTFDMKGVMSVEGVEIPFTGKGAFQVPGKVRLEITAEAGGQKATLVQLVNGDKVRQTENGQESALDEKMKEELRLSTVVQEISLIYPLLDASKFTLTPEKDADVGGKPAAVLGVKAAGLKDGKLYFDKQSGYLVRMQRKGLSPAGKTVDEVTDFSDFKKVDGMTIPMKSKVMQDGKPFLDISVTSLKPLEKADPKLFEIAP